MTKKRGVSTMYDIDEDYRIVDFNKYCMKCKHCSTAEFDEPCNTCLEHGVNEHTDKPINFEQK